MPIKTACLLLLLLICCNHGFADREYPYDDLVVTDEVKAQARENLIERQSALVAENVQNLTGKPREFQLQMLTEGAKWEEPYLLASYKQVLGSLDVRDGSGVTPLTAAAIEGRPESLVALLQLGADPNYPSLLNGVAKLSPLHAAAFRGNFRCAKLLLDAGAVAAAEDAGQQSPVDWLKISGQVPRDAEGTFDELVKAALQARVAKQGTAKPGTAPTALTTEEEYEQQSRALSERRQDVEQRSIIVANARIEDPNSLETILLESRFLFSQQAYTESLALAKRTVDLAPDNANAWHMLGDCYYHMRKLHPSVEALTKALALNPEQPDWLLLRAKANRLAGYYARAHEDLNAAVQLGLETGESLNLRGLIYDDQGQPAQAMSAFNKATQLGPWVDKPYCNRARRYRAAGDTAAALEQLNLAIACNPLDSISYDKRALYRSFATGSDDYSVDPSVMGLVLQDYQHSLRTAAGPADSASPHHNLGLMLEYFHQPGKAINHLTEAINAKPSLTWAYEARYKACKALGFATLAWEDLQMHRSLLKLDEIKSEFRVKSFETALEPDSNAYQVLREVALVKRKAGKQLPIWSHNSEGTVTLNRVFISFAAVDEEEFPLLAALAYGADVETLSPEGYTPIQLASKHGKSVIILKRLLEAGADPMKAGPEGVAAPEILASRHESVPFVREHFTLADLQGCTRAEDFAMLVDKAIAISIENDFAAIENLDSEQQTNQKSREAEESRIEELDVLIAGSTTGNGTVSERERVSMVNSRQSQIDFGRLQREQLAAQNSNLQKLEAMLLGFHIRRKARLIYGPESPEYEKINLRVIDFISKID